MGRDGEGEVSSRVTWDQGGQDSTTQKEGFQVSKTYVRVYNNCVNATNKRMCLGYK
jgi:hypothetical protein